MFGMGFLEIFLILIVAVIALGPEKLPTAAVEVVKFFKKFKSGIEDAKSTLDNELNMSEMKKEAESFKSSLSSVNATIDEASESIHSTVNSAASIESNEKPKAKLEENKIAKPTKKPKKETISFDNGEDK